MAEPTPVESIGLTVWYTTSASTYVGSPAWTQIEGIRDVTPPGPGKTDRKETTTHGTAASTKRKSYTYGLTEPSDWSFKQVYDKTTYNTLIALQRVKKGFKIVFSDGGTWYGDCFIEEPKLEAPYDGFMEVTWGVFNFGANTFATSS